MAKELNRINELKPFSFMALLAGNGQVPGAASGSTDKDFIAVMVDEAIREIASDLTAEGDFFSLMVENGMMAKEVPARKYNIRIVRPTSLGGGFPGAFGGGALAH